MRESGQRFADAALGILFNAKGQLQATGLEAAQALVLLQMYKVYLENSMDGELQLIGNTLRSIFCSEN